MKGSRVHFKHVRNILACRLNSVFLALVLVLSASLPVFAKTEQVQRVQDLEYGVVLYEFFQQNYFYAMTEIMVSQQQQRLPNHQAFAQLLMGGIQLSYGMDQQAKSTFESFLKKANVDKNYAERSDADDMANPENRSRAWFYLGKLAYQKNNIPLALDALTRVDKTLTPELHDEFAFLYQKIWFLNKEQSLPELSFSPKLSNKSIYRYYRDYNQAVNAIRSDMTAWGTSATALKRLYRALNQSSDSENINELLELRDKVLTTLAYLYLRQGYSEKAIDYFKQVRQDGSQVGRALVGYGWASIYPSSDDQIDENKTNQINYEAALTPWLKLQSRSMAESTTYEALLAVPFIYNAIGLKQQALTAYDYALNKMAEERIALKHLQSDINRYTVDKTLLSIVSDNTNSQPHVLSGGHWLDSEAVLFEPAEFNSSRLQLHLSELLASSQMRSLFGQLNDIYWLDNNLQRWRKRLDTFAFAVNERKIRTAEILSTVAQDKLNARLEQLASKNAQLSNVIEKAQDLEYADLLFTENERKSAIRIAKASQSLASIERSISENFLSDDSLPTKKSLDNMRQQLDTMHAMLYWQASSHQAERLWQKIKLQYEVESELIIARERLARLPLLADELTSQATYLQRIDNERQRIERQSDNLTKLRQKVELKIVANLTAEVEKRESRLQRYIGQVRLSKAVLLERQLSEPQQ